MSISTPFIQRPVATSLFIAALVLVGLVVDHHPVRSRPQHRWRRRRRSGANKRGDRLVTEKPAVAADLLESQSV
jgi:hypothetical protein